MKRGRTAVRVLAEARDLRSEDGENPEYDRALVELCQRFCGTGHDGHEAEVVRTLVMGER